MKYPMKLKELNYIPRGDMMYYDLQHFERIYSVS